LAIFFVQRVIFAVPDMRTNSTTTQRNVLAFHGDNDKQLSHRRFSSTTNETIQ